VPLRTRSSTQTRHTRDQIPTGLGKLTVSVPDGVWEKQMIENPAIMANVITIIEGLPGDASMRVPIPRTARPDLVINNIASALEWGRQQDLGGTSPGGTKYLAQSRIAIHDSTSGGIYELKNGKIWRNQVVSIAGISMVDFHYVLSEYNVKAPDSYIKVIDPRVEGIGFSDASYGDAVFVNATDLLVQRAFSVKIQGSFHQDPGARFRPRVQRG
jgi:hypothetical protein